MTKYNYLCYQKDENGNYNVKIGDGAKNRVKNTSKMPGWIEHDNIELRYSIEHTLRNAFEGQGIYMHENTRDWYSGISEEQFDIMKDIFNAYIIPNKKYPSNFDIKYESLSLNIKYCNNKFYIFDGNLWVINDIKNIYKKCKYESHTSLSKFENNIKKNCKDDEFKYTLNKNTHLMGFENCVLDFKNYVDSSDHREPPKVETGIKFRKGRSEDLISMSAGYELPFNDEELPISLDNAICKYGGLNNEIDDFFNKILPYEDVREYTLRFLSSCLSGEVSEERFYMWTGGNGKSMLVNLMNNTLGDYAKTMDSSCITSKKDNSKDLEKVICARFVSLSELEKHDSIYSGKLRQITGHGDKMSRKQLFKETSEFKPQFKMMLMCNDLHKLANVDDGSVVRRIEVVDFPSKFVDNPQPTHNDPFQFRKDITIDNKLKNWNIVFLFKLLEYYKLYRNEGTMAPPSVTKATNVYIIFNDPIQKWIKEDLFECDEPVSLNNLYNAFICWYDAAESNPKKVEKKEIKKALEEIQRKSKYGLIYGEKASDEAQNGYPKQPKFNFCERDDID